MMRMMRTLFRGRNNLSDDWIDAVAYERKKEDGKKYYHIVRERRQVADDDDASSDAIEAGYYEFTDEVLTDLDCDTDEEEEEKEEEESKEETEVFDDTKGQCHNRTLTLFLTLLPQSNHRKIRRKRG